MHREKCRELEGRISNGIMLIEVLELCQEVQAEKVWYLAGEMEPPYYVEPCGCYP